MATVNIIYQAMDPNMTAENLKNDADNFLLNAVTGSMASYEARHSQIQMMAACADAITDGGTLLAEAGTGTGKTFAYLIPIILSGKKAVISTRTKNLQEQLVYKDLAFLSSLRDCDYAIAKGRGNYLCIRRLRAFIPSTEEEKTSHRDFMSWASETKIGDFEELGGRRSPLQERICSDGDACRKTKCPFLSDCFYFKARRKWELAQIVVVNHALLAANTMMPHDSKALPQAEVLVVDEGHALDGILSEQIGITLSKQRCESVLNKFLRVDDRGVYKGLLENSPSLFAAVEDLRREMRSFWEHVSSDLSTRTIIRDTFTLADPLLSLAASARALLENIRSSAMGLYQEDDEIELGAAAFKLKVLADEMEIFAEGAGKFVRWAEIEEKRIGLRMAPIYPRDFIRSELIPEYKTLVLTSATLSVLGNFSMIQSVLGLEDAGVISLPSPFDLRKQAKVLVAREIDLRVEDGIGKLSQVILKEASRLEGGMLVLFTSRGTMHKTWEKTAEELEALGLCPLKQGDIPNRSMLSTMRDSTNCVIFGLDSFWEGVDVKGDALKSLIITKLPFEVPTEPMVVARVEAIRRTGGDAFAMYSLPRAILKFKQGFGRLIRSRSDTGRVIICDGRIETRRYGRQFLAGIF